MISFSPSGWRFLLFTSALHVPALFLPLASQSFEGAAQTGSLFLASFFSAMATIWWASLKLRDMFLTPLALCGAELIAAGIAWYVSRGPYPELRELVIDGLYGAVPKSIAFEIFACAVAAVGMHIRKRSLAFHVRKAADDWDEQRMLFEWLTACNPRREITFFRLQKLHERARCLVGVSDQIPFASACVVLKDDAVFFFDYSWALDTGIDQLTTFVRGLLARPESRGLRWYALLQEDPAPADALLMCGFGRVSPDDIDANLEIARFIRDFELKKLPDWKPLSGFSVFMTFLTPSFRDAA